LILKSLLADIRKFERGEGSVFSPSRAFSASVLAGPSEVQCLAGGGKDASAPNEATIASTLTTATNFGEPIA